MTARARPDFPYYAGVPVRLSRAGWLLVMAGCAAGFGVLTAAPHLLPRALAQFVGMAAFAGLPILALRIAAGPAWTALFAAPRWRDIAIGLAFAPLTLAVSFVVAFVVFKTTAVAANPAVHLLEGMDGAGRVVFLLGVAPQLFGEELVTILPFLAMLTLLAGALRMRRRWALALAWVASALVFGALHLPTYDWHVVQALGVIGVARLVLTLPYLVTRSIWASTSAHVANDWLAFGVPLLLGLGQGASP